MERWSRGHRSRALVAVALVLTALVGCMRDPVAQKQGHLERGNRYLAEGKHNEAIIELKNAIQVDPSFAPALRALGRAYAAKSWYPDAVRELQRAVDLEPDDVAGRLDLGRVFLELEAWNDALPQGRAILDKRPGDPAGTYIAAAALNGRGASREALELLAPVIAAGKSDAALAST